VFTSFTLSQAGMAKHHITQKEPGWRTGLFINGTGAVLSLVVDAIIAATKFSEGGWVIIVAVPILVVLLLRLNRQYVHETAELRQDAPRAASAPILRHHVVLIFVDNLDLAAARAIQYARSLTPDELRAVHFAVDTAHAEELRKQWSDLGLSRVPLDIVECPDRRLTRAAVNVVAEALGDGDTEVTILLPRLEYDRSWHQLLHDRSARAIAAALADVPHANVTFIPYHLSSGRRARQVIDADCAPATKATARPVRKRDQESPALPSSMHIPSDAVPIAQVKYRSRVKVVGRVKQVRVQPRADVATLQVTLTDGTGDIQIVFLGRRHIPGIAPGTFMSAEGVVGEHSGRPEMLNPDYNLLAPEG
jgi:hypothetical protein